MTGVLNAGQRRSENKMSVPRTCLVFRGLFLTTNKFMKHLDWSIFQLKVNFFFFEVI